MRRLLALLLSFGLQNAVLAQTTDPTMCTGLCLQQMKCSAGTTSISGTVFAPNGTDPLPNVTVYIPNSPVDAFTPGVSCPLVGTPPSGSPLVGTTTGFDGKFQLINVPVGTKIPLVIVTGRWRRQVTLDVTNACGDTPFNISFPKTQSEGDIPKIAVATGSVDAVECVLRKIGIADKEFTNAGGTGRINLYEGDGNTRSGGAIIDSSTAAESALMGDSTNLNSYDVLMLPCEGGAYTRSQTQLANLINFTNSGGRVYSSHFAYSWMYQNPPFDKVVNWGATSAQLNTGTATVDTSFSEGLTLAKWLNYVGASTSYGQMQVDTIRHSFSTVNPPTQTWLTLNTAFGGTAKPVMQFVFDAPVGNTTNQCGRVLFNEYHVEGTTAAQTTGVSFPNECVTSATLTPQEKLLEFSLFELTSDGAAATLDPANADFGSEPIGFTTASQSFTFTNNSTFVDTVNPPNTSGDFLITGNNCGVVQSGASCMVSVAFKPTALGARTGTLTVSAGAQTLVSALTGNGVPDISVSTQSIAFGSLDVGASRQSTLTVQSLSPSAIPFPGVTATGDFTATSNCGATLAANASCTVTVTFTPTATGPRSGTLTANSNSVAYSSLNDALTGNGVDFTVAISPTSGSAIAGLSTTTMLTMTPLAGFSAQVGVTCATNAVASPCLFASPNAAVLSTAATQLVTISTTAKYTVVGYGGTGSSRWLAVIAMLSAGLLWLSRKKAGVVVRAGLLMLFLGASSLLTSGCTGKLPALNPAYTAPGSYTYTMTATDGFLVHTATYNLTVTAK